MLKRHEILSFSEMISCLFVGRGLMRGGSATSPISSLREINLHSPYFAAYSSFSPFSILGGVIKQGNSERKYIMLVPMVLVREGNNERAMDLNSRLLQDRIVSVTGEIETNMAEVIKNELFYLESEDPTAPISMYINSPGGEVTSGMSIYDVMRYIRPKIHTIVCGMAASMGSVLLLAGDKRSAMPHSEIMIHQPSGGASGKSSDVEIAARHLRETKEMIAKLYEAKTHKNFEEIMKAIDRDNWLTPEQALNFGLIDDIIEPRN